MGLAHRPGFTRLHGHGFATIVRVGIAENMENFDGTVYARQAAVN